MRLPNFLVIGAPRCGTTTLHYCLGQHPEIFVSPNKETNFFLFDGDGVPPDSLGEIDLIMAENRSARTLEEYAALFAAATDAHRAIGESSPVYLRFPEVAARIKARLPDARLVVILRQPVDQALSFYLVERGGTVNGADVVDGFVDALKSNSRLANGRRVGLGLAEHGLYHRQLAAWYDHFDRDQIKVTFLDDLERDAAGYFADLFRFLGVDDRFRPELGRYNATGAVRSALVHRVINGSYRIKRLARTALPSRTAYHLARLQHRVRSANLRRTHDLPASLRRELTETFYAKDIAALERLIERDLGFWRQ